MDSSVSVKVMTGNNIENEVFTIILQGICDKLRTTFYTQFDKT